MNIKNISKPLFILAATTAVASGLGTYIWNLESRPPILEIYVFNLSSGRSMFIRTPEDKRFLIDGGSNSNLVRELTNILPFYSRRIDAVVATNTEGKNISGLIDIIDRYDVQKAFIPAVTIESLGLASSSDQIFSTFVNTLQRGNIEINKIIAGDVVDLDNKVRFEAIFPVLKEKFVYSKASAPELLFKVFCDNCSNLANNSVNNLAKDLVSDQVGDSERLLPKSALDLSSDPSLELQSNPSYKSSLKERFKTSVTFLGNASNKIQKFIASNSPTIGKTDVLIVSHSALPANISPILTKKIQPEYLIYSKTIKNPTTNNSTNNSNTEGVSIKTKSKTISKAKPIADPLVSIPNEKRFNLKEQGSVKITINGQDISVSAI